MSIIITERGKKPLRIDPSDFESEGSLQEIIHENPEAIPLYEIKEDVKLLVVAREFGTESGPIDALGVDREGDIYVIETKLYKNPDKRSVVAQALDYGAALWRHGSDFAEFTSSLDESVRAKFGVGLRDKLADFFALDESGVDALLASVSRNLNDGKFKFVVPMDKIHDRLKDLIVFLNQNSRFDFYAVELECYKLDERMILIPKLFGGEVKKAVDSSGSTHNHWTEEQMLADARSKLSPQELQWFESIWRFSKERADEVRLGRGAYGSFSAIFTKLSGKSLFTLGANGVLSLNFEWVGKDNPATRDRFKQELEKIGFRIADDYKETRPGVRVEEWGTMTSAFVKALETMLKA